MDLGIAGRSALVCASRKGLGRAWAVSLAREGAVVTLVARGAEALEATAHDIRRETGARVQTVAADITTPEGRAAVLARRFGRIVNITSAAVKAPIDILGLSNGARSGLTGFVAGLARKTVGRNVTINNLLPGPFGTDRLIETARLWSRQSGKTEEAVLAERRAGNPAGRFGTPAEFGDACAYLCSAQAGFITGQNLLLDGGHYPGTF